MAVLPLDFAGSRRGFLTAAAAASLIPLARAVQGQDQPPTDVDTSARPRKTYPIVLSTYSLWRFRNDDLRDIDKCIDLADEFGFDGVELLLYQIEQNDLLSHSKLMSYKRHALRLGLPLVSTAVTDTS
jgi:hypothetical protein